MYSRKSRHDVSEVKALRISETSVYFYEITRRRIPQNCHLHFHHCENLISHNTSQDSWSSDRDLNSRPVEYEVGVLTTRSRHWFFL